MDLPKAHHTLETERDLIRKVVVGPPAKRSGKTSAKSKLFFAAPTFDLKSLETNEEFNLAEYRGERPVLLFFGSYT